MLGSSWIALLNRIPPLQQDGLGVVTASGLEINITSIMRMEEDFLVIRGRIMGSTDAGRTFFVPYDQINCVVFQRFLKEPEVQAWFEDKPRPVAAAAPAQSPAAGEATETVPAAAAEPEPEPADSGMMQTLATTPSSGTQAPLPGKAAILERLRKRTSGSAPGTVAKPGFGKSAQGNVPKPPPAK